MVTHPRMLITTWFLLRRTCYGGAALLTATVAFGCQRADDESPRTTILAAADGGEAFEPTVAIDPADPRRILVAAMYGVPFARGAKGIWVWRSADGGRSWNDGRLDPPRLPDLNVEPTFAADVIADFGVDGTPLLASKSDAPPLGGTFLSRFAIDSSTVSSVVVYRNTIDSAAGSRVLHDKPWMLVDHDTRSPNAGSVYLSVGAITTGLGAAGIGLNWTPLAARVLLAVSRDGGRSFSSPVVVGDSASFGGYLAIGATGSLEIAYMRLRNKDGAGDAVFHRRSMDGGATFELPVSVATTTGDTLLELPVLAARPNGDVLMCWSQGVRADERANQVRCAHKSSDTGWSGAHDIDSALPPGVVAAWPTVVGTERGWYLMLYLVGTSRTEVALFRSGDGASFSRIATLSTIEGLGIDRLCVTLATACRRTRTDGFVIGDYVTLVAAGGRLAAAYVLPRVSGEARGAAVYVTTLAEPRKPAQ